MRRGKTHFSFNALNYTFKLSWPTVLQKCIKTDSLHCMIYETVYLHKYAQTHAHTRAHTYTHARVHTFTYTCYLWWNGYRRRICSRWHEFKSWTRLISFHRALMLYFDLRPGPKILFQGNTPEGSDTFQRPVIERDRVGGLRLMIW